MTPLSEIQRNRLIQRQLCLECSPSYLSAPDSVIQEEYNGCGPDSLNPWIRHILTDELHRFGPAFQIHDDDFARSTGRYLDFTAANKRLGDNCRAIVAAADVSDHKRDELYLTCELIEDACQWFGWPGYRDHAKVAEVEPGPEAPA